MRFAIPCIVALLLQNPGAPLPDSKAFIAEFRKTLRSDDELLSKYTFTETETLTPQDRKGNAKKPEINIYQVFPQPDRGEPYRRLISKNGVPLTQSQLDKEDRDQEKKKKDKASPRDDAKIRDELFAMYDIEMQGRESIEGAPAIVLSFRARPGYKPSSRWMGVLAHVAGRAWVNEADHQLVRLDAEVVDAVTFGWFLGRLEKGTHVTAERRKFNDEIYLPVKLDIQKSGRVLFKGIDAHEVHEYSDHKKFSAETTIIFPKDK